MKQIIERIAELDLDWREAEELYKAMKSLEKEETNLLSQQSITFSAMWVAVRRACKRNVAEKCPPLNPPTGGEVALMALEYGYEAHKEGLSLEQALAGLKMESQKLRG